jgi:benzoate-CoA ligase family protein
MSGTSIELRPWENGFQLPEQFNMASLLLERHLEGERADRPAILFDNQKISYSQLGRLTNQVGNGLAGLGINPHERVILLLNDSPEFIASFLGAMKIGAVPVPINVLATAKDLEYFIKDSQAAAVIAEHELFEKLSRVTGACPDLRRLIIRGGSEPGHPRLEELVEQASDQLDMYPTSKNDHSYWLYTSGTTGQPKGVIHQHKDLVYAVETWGRHVVAFKPDDVVYCVSRLFFSYGLNNGLYLPLYYGASVVLSPERPLPDEIIRIVEKYRPTMLFSVPTSYGQTLNHIENMEQPPDFSSLRGCISAGEALPGPLLDRWKKRFGLEILDGLGSSEVSFIYLCNLPGKVKKGSSGTLLPGYEAKILDEDEKFLPPGEVGDLWVKSQTLAEGYWNKPQKTAETFRDGWMKTGDRYFVDEDGYYFYFGRADDALKVSGIWVSPLEVEEALLSHDTVAECAIVAHKDDMGLVKPKAFVTVKNGITADEELVDQLKNFVKQKIAPYKYPRWIEFVDELPKTSTGKIQRYKLR